MGFSKGEHLRQNIEALRIAFRLEKERRKATEDERRQLMQYSGFGGLKFILNRTESLADRTYWKPSEENLFPLTRELFELLQSHASSDGEYRRLVASMRTSVLTAFYTPPAVITAIADTVRANGVMIERFLEPSAGMGSFIQPFVAAGTAVTAYEKDLLTGKVLQSLYSDHTIRIKGFEEIPEKEKGSFDVVASNIPFGDMAVFDLSYSQSKDPARVLASKSLHSYFFLKSGDMLREGGLLAFITSQGLLNSPTNEPIRRAMLRSSHLISAIRLPNNLFIDYAGTDVGSDLIVLQKDSRKAELTAEEELFCESRQTPYHTPGNALFTDSHRIIHTSFTLGTDPYGHPAMVYVHQDGVEGIARDLQRQLAEDFTSYFRQGLYHQQTPAHIGGRIIAPPAPLSSSGSLKATESPRKEQQPTPGTGTLAGQVQLSLFDLYEKFQTVPAAVSAKPDKKTQSSEKKTQQQANLFDREFQDNKKPSIKVMHEGLSIKNRV